jgi:hypothetical protein
VGVTGGERANRPDPDLRPDGHDLRRAREHGRNLETGDQCPVPTGISGVSRIQVRTREGTCTPVTRFAVVATGAVTAAVGTRSAVTGRAVPGGVGSGVTVTRTAVTTRPVPAVPAVAVAGVAVTGTAASGETERGDSAERGEELSASGAPSRVRTFEGRS